MNAILSIRLVNLFFSNREDVLELTDNEAEIEQDARQDFPDNVITKSADHKGKGAINNILSYS